MWCGWKGKALVAQPFHFCKDCLPGLDAGQIEVLDEQPCERLDSTEGDVSLTGVAGWTLHVDDDLVQSESLHFVDGTRPGQQQGKLAPAHLHGLVPVILFVVALGNGTVSDPRVIDTVALEVAPCDCSLAPRDCSLTPRDCSLTSHACYLATVL